MPDAEYEESAKQMVDLINEFGAQFDVLCRERHEMGAQEYGQFTFLGNDIIRMMAEEMADIANYCRYEFVKLMFLQRMLEQNLDLPQSPEGDLQVGWQSFKGVSDTGWSKS